MPPKIVWFQFDAYLFSQFVDHLASGGVRKLKYPIFLSQPLLLNIGFLPLSDLFRHENGLPVLPALWILNKDLPPIDILDSDVENLPDTCSAFGL